MKDIKLKLSDKQLGELFKECLIEIESGILLEAKDDNKSIIKKEIKEFIESSDPQLKKLINDKVLEAIKGKDSEKHLVEICRNVLTQLYKTLWTKRSFWTNDLKNVTA